jgi:hypothetical protein
MDKYKNIIDIMEKVNLLAQYKTEHKRQKEASQPQVKE